MSRAILTGRPAHAYLFAGAEGIGKAAAALRFAAMLNCRQAAGDALCDCRSCRKILDRKSPDLFIETPEKTIRIEVIRNLQSAFKYAPVEALYRVAIIDDAHLMNRSAQNALLKTLEEPPAGRILILVTSKPGALLPTVRSRCRTVRFSPLSTSDVVQVLAQSGIAHETAETAAAMSGGSPGKAIEMTKPSFLRWREKIISVMAAPMSAGVTGLLEFSAELAGDKEGVVGKIEIAKSFVRDTLMEKTTQIDKINQDFCDTITTAAERYSIEQLTAVYDELTKASELLEAEINVNKNLILDIMLLKIAGICEGAVLKAM